MSFDTLFRCIFAEFSFKGAETSYHRLFFTTEYFYSNIIITGIFPDHFCILKSLQTSGIKYSRSYIYTQAIKKKERKKKTRKNTRKRTMTLEIGILSVIVFVWIGKYLR